MADEDVEKVVLAYLRKKGFKQTELAFQEEQHQQQQGNKNSSTSSSSTASHTTTDPEIAKHLLAFSEHSLFFPLSSFSGEFGLVISLPLRTVAGLENGPARYREGYGKLRSWADGSLDLYRHEMNRVLYPLL
ncbi:TFIID subunit TAF5, NTD2 domain [Dillenia turbinata]|uniref:TFIID subunit TAF5, NTD2 domain n=1 Tax=Dillenia turbinata TaxID=194707 RepID=A0AAN8YTK7_9MAGN